LQANYRILFLVNLGVLVPIVIGMVAIG